MAASGSKKVIYAAMLGPIVALAGIAAAAYLGIPELDGAASIGIILGLTAILLEREIKSAYPEIRRIFIEAQSFAAHRRMWREATD